MILAKFNFSRPLGLYTFLNISRRWRQVGGSSRVRPTGQVSEADHALPLFSLSVFLRALPVSAFRFIEF
jgi:hypothetical protein